MTAELAYKDHPMDIDKMTFIDRADLKGGGGIQGVLIRQVVCLHEEFEEEFVTMRVRCTVINMQLLNTSPVEHDKFPLICILLVPPYSFPYMNILGN